MWFLASISQKDMERIIQPILDVCKVVVPSLLTIIGTVGAIYCILLGVKYSKAEDPQEHEKAKNALKNAIVGFVLIFVLLVMLTVGVEVFTNYYNNAVASS